MTKASGLSGSGSWLFGLEPDGSLAWGNADAASDVMAPKRVARGADGSLLVTTSNGLNFIRKHAVGGALLWNVDAQSGSVIEDIDVGPDGRLLTVGIFTGGISKQAVPQVTIWSAEGVAESGGFAVLPSQPVSFGRWAEGGLLLGGTTTSGLAFGPMTYAGLGASDGWVALVPL